MSRKVADCRKYPSEMNCTLTIIGEEDEVVRAAAEHAASVHGEADTPDSREAIRGLLEDEESAGMRFVQLIEFKTKQRDEVNRLLDEWESATGGKRTATRTVLTVDHETPETYYEFVEFPSFEQAMRNSQLPETDAIAKRMREICEGDLVFHNLDVVRAEAL